MRAVNALDLIATSNAVRAAAQDLLATALPWRRSVSSDICVLMNPTTFDALYHGPWKVNGFPLSAPGYPVMIASYEIILDATIPPDTIRVRDRRNVRDEIVRLTL